MFVEICLVDMLMNKILLVKRVTKLDEIYHQYWVISLITTVCLNLEYSLFDTGFLLILTMTQTVMSFQI